MNCIIIHGSPSREKPDEPKENLRNWIFWLKTELEKRGIKTYTPLMPVPWNPKYKEWKKEFEKLPLNEESVLVGHSAGGGFLVRYLGETKKKIKKLILVAPAIIYSGGWPKLNDLLKFEINNRVKENVDDIIIFVSDDESEGIKESVKIYSKELGVKPIELHEKGHFLEKSMGTKKFPELLNKILE